VVIEEEEVINDSEANGN